MFYSLHRLLMSNLNVAPGAGMSLGTTAPSRLPVPKTRTRGNLSSSLLLAGVPAPAFSDLHRLIFPPVPRDLRPGLAVWEGLAVAIPRSDAN